MSILEYSPIYAPQYPQFIELFKKQQRAHWIHEEIKLQVDVEQWKNGKITPDEKQFIKSVLRLFTESDKAVASGYYDKLIPAFKNNEVRMMLGAFANLEAEHQLSYALLNDTLGFGESFYYEFLEWSEMKEKYEFMIEQHDISKPRELASYLAKQMFIEGVSLFSSFVMLINFDRRGLLPGMADVVRLSSADESLHVEGLSQLFKHLLKAFPEIVTDDFKKDIYDCAREVIRLEDAFIDLVFKNHDIKGLTTEETKSYARYVTDARLTQLGLKKNFGMEKNPIQWAEDLLGSVFGNFFEREITQYSKANLSGEYNGGY
jgi:glutaredoxin 3